MRQQFGPFANSLFGELSPSPAPAPAVAPPPAPAPAPVPAPAPATKAIVLKPPVGKVTYQEHSAVSASVRRLLNMSARRKTQSLSQADQEKLRVLFVGLQKPTSSTGKDAAALELLHRMATQWDGRALFPSLYLLRLLLLASGPIRESTKQVTAIITFLTTEMPSACASSDALMTQVLRACYHRTLTIALD